MLRGQPWLHKRDGLLVEIDQATDEGRIVPDALIKEAKQVFEEHGDEKKCTQIIDQLRACPVTPDYPYDEPSDLEGILNLRGEPVSLPNPDAERVYDRAYGAWLGRCAGCLLGQPVEGWRKARIGGLLKATGNDPVSGYMRSDISPEIREEFGVTDEGSVYGSAKINWINNVTFMPEDDDTNYTVIALKLLKEYGPGFTADDAAENWLKSLPLLHVCTAERVAYVNLCNAMYPPDSASHYNPYREWIGAQIRGDLFGYVTPGDPERGASMAFMDASISHVKNGIYGEMWVAAMLSAAAVTEDVKTAILAGLSQIPKTSRLHEEIDDIVARFDMGETLDGAMRKFENCYDETNAHHWCHTISNAAIVTMALLYGEKDFSRTMDIALKAGFDTDCNCATAGSVLGMMLGAEAMPEAWVKPLNDTLISGVDGMGRVRISDLARETVALMDLKGK